MTLARTLAAALAAAALAAPAALAQPAHIHAPLIQAGARPDTAGNPNVAATTDDHAARPDTAGNPNVAATKAGWAVTADTGDGIATMPFVTAVVGALLIGLGAGSGLHLMHVRRRHATELAA